MGVRDHQGNWRVGPGVAVLLLGDADLPPKGLLFGPPATENRTLRVLLPILRSKMDPAVSLPFLRMFLLRSYVFSLLWSEETNREL
jgi:hypothetical protein